MCERGKEFGVNVCLESYSVSDGVRGGVSECL